LQQATSASERHQIFTAFDAFQETEFFSQARSKKIAGTRYRLPSLAGGLWVGTVTGAQSACGTTQQDYSVWWEWRPAFATLLTNFSVAPGDVMSCTICANSPTSGSIYLLNVSSGQATSFTVSPPNTNPPTILLGNSAEWIVSRWGDPSYPLAAYGVVYFDESHAFYVQGPPGSNQNGTGIDLGAGTFLTMIGIGNAPLSVPTEETPRIMEVTWEAAN
jgi:hypothetical protein